MCLRHLASRIDPRSREYDSVLYLRRAVFDYRIQHFNKDVNAVHSTPRIRNSGLYDIIFLRFIVEGCFRYQLSRSADNSERIGILAPERIG